LDAQSLDAWSFGTEGCFGAVMRCGR
jgi:hypothetical protein